MIAVRKTVWIPSAGKIMTMDTKQIYRYLRGEATEAEKQALDRWVGESDANRRLYRETRLEYEFLIMNASGSRKGQRKSRRWTAVAVAVANVAAAALFFVSAAYLAEKKVAERFASQEVTVDIPAGQRMTITLPDSTVVDLNSGTRLTYPAVFTGGDRLVKVDGEAMFHVSHDEDKSFIVNTFAADIKVLGTEFNVYADSREEVFSTSLVNGRVMVTVASDPDMEYYLVPDHTLSLRDGKVYIEDMLDRQVNYWTEGLINISGMSFSDLMRRFSRAYGVEIVIQREEMPDLGCTSGEIRVSDGIDHALKVLQHIADFTYRRDSGTGIIYIR